NAIDEVLLIFKKDTEENLQQLHTAATDNDIEQLNKIAHKMLPMFRQLEIQNAIPILEVFEVLKNDEISHNEVMKKFKELEKGIENLIDIFSKKITNPNHNN
ncbi:MAG: hypothetical protein ABJI22_03950, partial [Maribacter sp.]